MEIALCVVLRARFSLLLGYYADMIFNEFSGAFKKTIQFLFESVGYLQPYESVIALQSIDALCTIVSDSDLAPRLEPMLPRIVEIINILIATNKYPSYFEFLLEFCKYYAVVLPQYIISILSTVVTRILVEHNLGSSGSTALIGKCWNVIRTICERSEFVPLFNQQIEECLKQLYMFMVDPTKISFEDEVIMNVRQLIRRNK